MCVAFPISAPTWSGARLKRLVVVGDDGRGIHTFETTLVGHGHILAGKFREATLIVGHTPAQSVNFVAHTLHAPQLHAGKPHHKRVAKLVCGNATPR